MNLGPLVCLSNPMSYVLLKLDESVQDSELSIETIILSDLIEIDMVVGF